MKTPYLKFTILDPELSALDAETIMLNVESMPARAGLNNLLRFAAINGYAIQDFQLFGPQEFLPHVAEIYETPLLPVHKLIFAECGLIYKKFITFQKEQRAANSNYSDS